MSKPPRRAIVSKTLLTAVLIAAVASAGGCAVAGVFAHAFSGGTQSVSAQYRGLEEREVAVMVAADEYIYADHPRAVELLTQRISGEIADNVQDAQLTSPREVLNFKYNTLGWASLPYGELVEEMGVERLVLVDLGTYRTHEPGNPHQLQGVISGEIHVFEAESSDPDNSTYYRTVRSEFPDTIRVGLPDNGRSQIELGVAQQFSRDVGRLFYDHEIERDE